MHKVGLESIRVFIIGVFCAAVLFGCGKKEGGKKDDLGKETDRKALLANLADQIIIPAYADFKVKLDEMLRKSDEFTQQPSSQRLAAFRSAWQEAYIAWQKVELFNFGPAQTYALSAYFNIYPSSPTKIDANILSGNANLDLPSNYDAQGFPAIDTLINGLAANDTETVSFYTTDPQATKRIQYLKKITTQMNTVFSQVYNAWSGPYAATFKSRTAIDAGSPTSTMVNGYIFNYEKNVRSAKIGIPVGAFTNWEILPNRVEAYHKEDLSLTLAKTAHQAAHDFYRGKAFGDGSFGYSLKDYLSSLGTKDTQSGMLLADIIDQQFDVVTAKLGFLDDNLSNEVINNNQKMREAYEEMQMLVRLLKTDMTSAMSISISYTDNDGD